MSARPPAVLDDRLLSLVGCIHGIVLEFDGQARYLNAWADDPTLLAQPPDEMIGRTINEVLGEVAGTPFTQMVLRVCATGVMEHLEYPLDLAGGRRWFFADVKRVENARGDQTIVFFARDITDRRAVEQALARSEERFRLAAMATNDVLWDWDLVRDHVTWNAAVSVALGYERPGDTGQWWKAHIHPDDGARVIDGLERAISGGASAWSDHYRFERADGSYGDFVDRGFIVRDGSGTPVRMIGSMTDVTAINRMQAQLVQADHLAALGTLAAGVGHEINNPLSYVICNIESVIEELPQGNHRQQLTDALEGAHRITDIVRSLRTFSRPDTAEAAPIDVQPAIEAALKMAESAIRFRAKLSRSFGSVPQVVANGGQLAQVCLNLLINAAQAIAEGDPDHNEIGVATFVSANGAVTIEIKDTGTGIPAHNLARVFDPFFTTKPVGTGSGLGLSICHTIVGKLGGEIVVESREGSGSTFHVRLPPVAAKRRRVLVIDDEVQIGRIVARMLDKHADVVHVPRAREGLSHLTSAEAFDVVLCDLMMPEMTGIELYEHLQRVAPSVLSRVHFMSGGAFTPRAHEFLEALARPCIDKPLTRARLMSLLAAA